MAGRPKKRARTIMAKAFFARDDGLKRIIAFIYEGGTLVSCCSKLGIDYRTTVEWLDSDPERKAAFEKANAGKEGRLRETVREVLARAVRANLSDALDEKYKLKPLAQLPADVKGIISGITVDALGFVKEVKFQDQLRAAELLGKSLKMFTDKHEHEVGESLADLLALSNRPEKTQ